MTFFLTAIAAITGNARRTVLARVSGLVSLICLFFFYISSFVMTMEPRFEWVCGRCKPEYPKEETDAESQNQKNNSKMKPAISCYDSFHNCKSTLFCCCLIFAHVGITLTQAVRHIRACPFAKHKSLRLSH